MVYKISLTYCIYNQHVLADRACESHYHKYYQLPENMVPLQCLNTCQYRKFRARNPKMTSYKMCLD